MEHFGSLLGHHPNLDVFDTSQILSEAPPVLEVMGDSPKFEFSHLIVSRHHVLWMITIVLGIILLIIFIVNHENEKYQKLLIDQDDNFYYREIYDN